MRFEKNHKDNSGEFVPCHFSDDEEAHDLHYQCALCQYGGSGEAHSVIQRMQDIDSQMVGKIKDDDYIHSYYPFNSLTTDTMTYGWLLSLGTFS